MISNNISASSLETNSRIDLQVLEGNHDISPQPGYVGPMDPISKLERILEIVFFIDPGSVLYVLVYVPIHGTVHVPFLAMFSM